MTNFTEPNSFLSFFHELPLVFKFFGGLVIGGFAYVIIKGLATWISNNASEVTQKRCKVVDKRTEVWGGSGDSSANTNYYITFELEDSSRIELHVKDKYFGLITIGDIGELIYQGTRFKEFNRQ
jgi:hypothetical protein